MTAAKGTDNRGLYREFPTLLGILECGEQGPSTIVSTAFVVAGHTPRWLHEAKLRHYRNSTFAADQGIGEVLGEMEQRFWRI